MRTPSEIGASAMVRHAIEQEPWQNTFEWAVEEARKGFAAGPWIPVTERFPPDGDNNDYLCMDRKGDWHKASFDGSHWLESGGSRVAITHWSEIRGPK